MRIEQLQAFEEIACSKSISIAAQNLFITQPSLSRSIKSLEEELNLSLFTRFADGVSLTKEGRTLLPYTHKVLQDLQSLSQEAQELAAYKNQDATPIQFKICAMQSITDTILVPSFEAMNGTFPHVDFTVKILGKCNPQVLPNLAAYDLFIGTSVANNYDAAIEDSALEVATIFFDRFSAVLNRQHPLAARKVLDINDMLDYKLIYHNYDFSTEDFYQKLIVPPNAGKKLDILLRSNNARVITSLLLTSDAILNTNNIIASNDYAKNDQLVTIPIKNFKYHVFCLYPTDSAFKPLIHQFIALLQKTRTRLLAK